MEVQEAKVTRRRSRRSKRHQGDWNSFFRSKEFGRLVFLGMCLLSLAYFARFVWDTRWGSLLYNSVLVDLSDTEVRYVLGPPGSVEQGGRLYRYTEGNKEVVVRFSENRTLTSVACTAEPRYASQCDPTLDVRIGMPENQVLLALGGPSRVAYEGDDKIMFYDGLGLRFRMRKFKVHAIELHEGGSFIGLLPQALWRMIP